MNALSATVLSCLALLGAAPVLAQSVPAPTSAPAAHAKVYVTVPQVSTSSGANGDAGSWRAQLERSGILSQSGPYRIGLPIAEFGAGGPKLMFTYIPRMRDGVGSRVLMFMLRTSID